MVSEESPETKFNRHRYRIDSEILLLLLSVLMGVIGALGAVLFRLLIQLVQFLLFELPNDAVFQGSPILIILTPTVGGLIVGYIVSKFAPEAKGHGVPEIITSVNLHGGKMRYRVPFAKIFASAITIGSGGSAGREGPIAQIGGGIASLISSVFKLKEEDTKTLVISGVAAGISATFNAPLGGVLFGLEVIRRDEKTFPVIPLITASVVGTAIGEKILGNSPAFIFPQNVEYSEFTNIPFYILLGLLMGIFSMFLVRGFYKIEDLFVKLKIGPILLAGFGGLLVGIIELNYPEVSGVSYQPIDAAFALEYSIGLLLILAVLKFIATSITLGTGGSGGVFAPTLFIGVMIGTAYGLILNQFGLRSTPTAIFALVGMAALFAGSSHAPLTAIIMTAEMVGDYKLFIPLMFAVSISWIISRYTLKDDVYILKLKRKGIKFEKNKDILESILVRDIMVTDIVSVSGKDRLESVLTLMKETGHTGYPVLDGEEIIGIITEHDVDEILDASDVRDWIIGEHCTKEVETIIADCPVSYAIIHMDELGINRFPVVEEKGSHKIIGWLTRSDVMAAYREEKRRLVTEEFETALFDHIQNKEQVDK